jgi:hypothetical protein
LWHRTEEFANVCINNFMHKSKKIADLYLSICF